MFQMAGTDALKWYGYSKEKGRIVASWTGGKSYAIFFYER